MSSKSYFVVCAMDIQFVTKSKTLKMKKFIEKQFANDKYVNFTTSEGEQGGKHTGKLVWRTKTI